MGVNGDVFQWLLDRHRLDREVALTAVLQTPSAFNFIPNELLNFIPEDYIQIQHKSNNDEINQTFFRRILQNVPDKLKNDWAFMLQMLRLRPWVFPFVSNELQEDRDFVLSAVRQKGSVLQWVSNKFKADRAIVLTAVRSQGFAFIFASDELKPDRNFILAVVRELRDCNPDVSAALLSKFGDWAGCGTTDLSVSMVRLGHAKSLDALDLSKANST